MAMDEREFYDEREEVPVVARTAARFWSRKQRCASNADANRGNERIDSCTWNYN